MNKKNKTSGITLLEVLVTMGILMVLAAASVSSLFSYRNRQVLNTETSQILSMLNKARSQTLASKSQLYFGVRLNTDRIILYSTTFSSSTPGNEEYVLHHSISLSSISLSSVSAGCTAGLDVLFDRLNGETKCFGTFRVGLSSDSSQYHVIGIKQTGLIGLDD